MTEHQLQAKMVAAFNRKAKPHQRRLLSHNHNNAPTKAEQARLTRLGITPGRPDLTLYAGNMGRTVMIEVKTPTGSQSKAQKAYQEAVEKAGYPYYIVRTVDDFMRIVSLYLDI